MFVRTALAAASLVFATTAADAQSSLGIHAGGLTLGVTATDSDSFALASGWLDVAITGAHGLQFGVTLENTPAGALGSLDAHLYLAPQDTAKYGFFVVASDLDGGDFTMGLLGAEGLLALGPRTTAEIRGGIGIAKRLTAPDSLDFIFAGGAVTREVSPALRLGLAVELAEYDEAALSAVGYTITAEADWRRPGSPLALTAALGVSGLEGRDGAPAESFVRLGLSYSFGAGTGTHRPFRRPDPYAPLALRGMF